MQLESQSTQGSRLQKRLTRVMQTTGRNDQDICLPTRAICCNSLHFTVTFFRESFNGYSVGQETGHQDK